MHLHLLDGRLDVCWMFCLLKWMTTRMGLSMYFLERCVPQENLWVLLAFNLKIGSILVFNLATTT